ncbi:MAG: tRNA (cytidine(56)-2'-O)-methyltransferase [Candidatus Micrarchaeota archaeon]|nr:tRNA (cytidine(56)-2'-O)-methyltransferase [Candidatus Micrarchaeota archaeon]
MAEICVLRLGHRQMRDQRITTHVFLVARALGATEGVLSGDLDESVVKGIARVSEIWGGNFKVRHEPDWRKFLAERKRAGWKVAHLTMYGEDFRAAAKKLSAKNCVVVIGAGKVPREAYELADFNLSVTTQPHSEVGALALFLDRYFMGKELGKKFSGKIRIVPNVCGKVVQHVESD